MFPFHCNQCYRRPKNDSSLELAASQCGHILCKDCILENCGVCKRPFKAVAINKDMPSSLAEYFSNPLKHFQHYKKIMKFQHEQERRWVEYTICRTNEEKKKVQTEIEGITKLNVEFKLKIEKERKRIQKLREFIASNDRIYEKALYTPPPPISCQPRPRYPVRRHTVANDLLRPVNSNMMINRFLQPIRPLVIYPNSSTEGINVPKQKNESIQKKERTPPPLLSFSQAKHLNLKFSSNPSK